MSLMKICQELHTNKTNFVTNFSDVNIIYTLSYSWNYKLPPLINPEN